LYLIKSINELAPKIWQIWVNAPHVAFHAKAGQFVILRINEFGERIPLTISAIEGDDIRCIFMAVGKTTSALAAHRSGDYIRDVAGPLGKPSEIKKYGTCVVIGGGAGIACCPIIARSLKADGNVVKGIIGARNAELLILEDEMRDSCDELFITTDDGSKGVHGFVSDILKTEIQKGSIDAVWIIGPAIMMKVTSEVTRPVKIRTFVSLNPIMVDGTGMCGSCRVKIGDQIQFACVDGPEFDAHKVDFDLLMKRQRAYLQEEKLALEYHNKEQCKCGGPNNE